MSTNHDRCLWDRLDDEPEVWFERFEVYLKAGATRKVLDVCNAERAAAGEPRATLLPEEWGEAADEFHWANRVYAYDAQVKRDRYERIEACRQEVVEVQVLALKVLQRKALQAMETLEPEAATWPQVVAALRLAGNQVKDGTCEVPDVATHEDCLEAESADTQIAHVAAAAKKDWKAAKWLLENRHSKLMQARDFGWAMTIEEYWQEMLHVQDGMIDALPAEHRQTIENRMTEILDGRWPQFNPDQQRPQQMLRRATPDESLHLSRPFAPLRPPELGPYHSWRDMHLGNRRQQEMSTADLS